MIHVLRTVAISSAEWRPHCCLLVVQCELHTRAESVLISRCTFQGIDIFECIFVILIPPLGVLHSLLNLCTSEIRVYIMCL